MILHVLIMCFQSAVKMNYILNISVYDMSVLCDEGHQRTSLNKTKVLKRKL